MAMPCDQGSVAAASPVMCGRGHAGGGGVLRGSLRVSGGQLAGKTACMILDNPGEAGGECMPAGKAESLRQTPDMRMQRRS